MIREAIKSVSESNVFDKLKLYITKKEEIEDLIILYVDKNDIQVVDDIIQNDSDLSKMLDTEETKGGYRIYHFRTIKESDGGYGDLGVIPTAPSRKADDERNFIVSGKVVKG